MPLIQLIKNKSAYILLLLGMVFLSGCGFCLHSGGSADSSSQDSLRDQEEFSLRNDPIWSDEESMKAMVLSDLHYTENADANPSLVPGIALAEEITDAIVAEVIDRHPDVLIMTGDNTDSGKEKDVHALVQKLQTIRDKGISIILTTGNHDFNHMNAEEFEEAYFGLLNPVDRDPDSLSYTAIVKDVVFLVMDDNSLYNGGHGEFSQKTIWWIGEILEKYRTHPVIFLSHHNVIYGYGKDNSDSHLIQNPDLPELLTDGGVRLALTGHMHSQYITKRGGLWEILSGMPFSGEHLIGNLAVDEDKILYYAEPVDFEEYDSAIVEELDRLDRASADYISRIFSKVLDQKGVRGSGKSRVQGLLDRFFRYYGQGTLSEHRQELMDDPAYERMITLLWDSNYGPWIKEMIETTRYSSRKLEIPWQIQNQKTR
ncbi:MAG TPA: hypothetical protein DCG37_04885 [Lachnospiraceae bacterium]|nr:hypothetical protein [Lachnospiraceae bacterium]